MAKASRKKKGAINEALGNQGIHDKESALLSTSPAKAGSHKRTSIIKYVPILILLLVSFAVYFNALSGDFVYDDEVQIIENSWIRDIRYIPTIFSKSVWGFKPELSTSNYYRPLMHIVYMFNYHLFGLNPWGFHLVNILFHCGAAVLVFLVIWRLLPEQRASVSSVYLSPPFIAALLFATHPIHTEAVTWIAGLPDVTFTFFYLLSFYLYISFREGSRRSYIFSLLTFSVATLFKEPALTLPLILVAYDYLLKGSDETLFARIKRYIPYIAISVIYLLVRYYALRNFAPLASYPDLTTYQFIINIFPLFSEYLASLLWPFDLNLWHTFHPIRTSFEAKGIISMVVTVIFFIVAIAAYRKNKLVLFSLLLLLIPLLPAFYIKGIGGKPFAERYLYLPSAGHVLLLAICLSWGRRKMPKGALGVTVVFLLLTGFYAAATTGRNAVWKDDIALWTDTVKKSPDSEKAYDNLGNAYASQGLFNQAIVEYEEALRLKPDCVETHNNLGLAYESQGLWEKATAEYQAALQLKPDCVDAHNNLGAAYASQGLWDRAISEYQKALRLKPDCAEVHNNLGLVYASQGLWDRAIAEYQAALQLKPDCLDAFNNLGNAYASQGLWDRAILEYQAALRLMPDCVESHNNLGLAYASQGLWDRAILEYQAALQLKPDCVESHNNLGLAYASQGLWDRAIPEYQAALRLKPDCAEAHSNLGAVYASQGLWDRAVAEYQAALRLKPDFHKARQRLNDILSRRQ